MMAKPELTAEDLRHVVSYDPETGRFCWLQPRRFCTPGKSAGGLTPYGYVRISIHGRPYQAHRLAWLYVHGEWPVREIDHINGVRDDNRLSNLREATPSQNQANKRMRSDNTSGVKGVTWDKSKSRWQAGISVNGSFQLIGRFQNLDDAAEAYRAASQKIYGEFSRPERIST